MFRSWTPRFLQGLTRVLQPRPDSLRLTFHYDQTGIRLLRKTKRGKAAPKAREGEGPLPPDRIVVEVRGKDGRALYRQVLRDPIPQSAEVFEPSGTIRRIPAQRSSGVFSVVIPTGIGAGHLVILAGPEVELAGPGFTLKREAQGRTREIFRMPLGSD